MFISILVKKKCIKCCNWKEYTKTLNPVLIFSISV